MKVNTKVIFDLGDGSPDDWVDDYEIAEKHDKMTATIVGITIEPLEGDGEQDGYFDIKFNDGVELEGVSGHNLTKIP